MNFSWNCYNNILEQQQQHHDLLQQQHQHQQQQQQQHREAQDLQQQQQQRWGGDLELAASSPLLLPQLDMLDMVQQPWGTNLELASPGAFDMDTSWSSAAREHCAAQGLEVVPSPSCSAASIRNLSSHILAASRMTQNIHQQQQQQQQGMAVDSVDVSSSSSVGSLLNRASLSGNSSRTSNLADSGHSQRSNDESVGSPSGVSTGFNNNRTTGAATTTGTMNNSCRNGNAIANGRVVGACEDEEGWDMTNAENHNSSEVGEINRGGEASNAANRGPTERMMEITLEELSRYFSMPITQASKELKVGLTVLKKRCREFGIPRWPHRKLKSLESLIHKSQELARDSQGRPPNPVIHAVQELEKQKKKMEQSPGLDLDERTKRFRQAIFKASYKQRRRAILSSKDTLSPSSQHSATDFDNMDEQQQPQY